MLAKNPDHLCHLWEQRSQWTLLVSVCRLPVNESTGFKSSRVRASGFLVWLMLPPVIPEPGPERAGMVCVWLTRALSGGWGVPASVGPGPQGGTAGPKARAPGQTYCRPDPPFLFLEQSLLESPVSGPLVSLSRLPLLFLCPVS